MASRPNKISRPWVCERKPFERERKVDAFDYNCRQWRKVRRAKLEKNPVCEECERLDLVTVATVVDHRIRIEVGGDAWDESNLQSLCKKHHDSKSGRERHR